MDFWEECISESFDDAGITATKDQIGTVAYWVEGAHENYGMAHGYDCIPNPLNTEIERLKNELKIEREKGICPECKGKGGEMSYGGTFQSFHECSKCQGSGIC